MANSTATAKPEKPYPEFPLYAHASKRWAKKIKGRTHFFGPWRDWQGALERYEHDVHHLMRGRKPPPMDQDDSAVNIGFLVNTFLERREKLVATGELSQQTYYAYKRTGAVLIEQLGRYTLVEQLAPKDFAELREHFAKGKGLVSLRNSVARSMVFFNFAKRERLIPHEVNTGESFQRPGKVALKREKNAKDNKRFTIEELTTIYQAANPQLKCFMLLGLNGGLGNGDIGRLEGRHIQGDWIDYPRPKTQVERRFKLWPETKKAIAANQQRKRPDIPLVFLTKRGESWFKDSDDDPLSKEFRKLCIECGCHVKGRGFYALRHMFRSVARGCRDREAIDWIMGHSDDSMGSLHYNEWAVDDKRLQAVTDHVRKWARPIIKPTKKRSTAKAGKGGAK